MATRFAIVLVQYWSVVCCKKLKHPSSRLQHAQLLAGHVGQAKFGPSSHHCHCGFLFLRLGPNDHLWEKRYSKNIPSRFPVDSLLKMVECRKINNTERQIYEIYSPTVWRMHPPEPQHLGEVPQKVSKCSHSQREAISNQCHCFFCLYVYIYIYIIFIWQWYPKIAGYWMFISPHVLISNRF